MHPQQVQAEVHAGGGAAGGEYEFGLITC